MHIDQLRYIVEVAQTGSITRASENLHVSPATISQSISNVEKKFKITLFNRSRLGTIPSDEGKKIIEKAFEIVRKADELEKVVETQVSSIDDEIKLVCTSGSLLTLLPKTISTYKNRYPNTNVVFKEQSYQPNILEEVKQNDFDIGIISVNANAWVEWGKLHKKFLHFETLSQGSIYVSVSRSSSLALKDEITPEELLDQNIIIHSNMSPIFEDLFNQYGKMNVIFESYNSEVIKGMIDEGLGISLFSNLFIKDDPYVKNHSIVPIRLVNYERANLTYGWVRSNIRPFSSTARDFIKILREEVLNSGL
ncbi:LysR family transcriptional regulator [Bacillus sp. JJ1521]|uniref:LysR family transcriptional regulator n=1 Tax=Bacillus sp. JJ1521 TaxID=3122957 RepID=UPI002FFE59A0